MSLVAFTAAACAGRADSTDSTKPALSIAQNSSFWRPALEASGVLDDLPYKIEWSTFSTGADTANTLITKRAEVALDIGNITSLVQAANADTPWTADSAPYKNVLLGTDHDSISHSNAVTIVSADSGITSGAQLRGKKWGYVKGSNSEAQFIYSIRKAGLISADVENVIIPNTAGAQAVANGDIDVWSSGGREAVAAIQAGAKLLWNGPDVGFTGLSVLAARSDILKNPEKSDLIGDFAERVARYHIWSQTNQDKLVPIYASASKYTEQQAKDRAQFCYNPLPVSPEVISREQDTADVLSAAGFLRSPLDVNALYDDRFSERVKSVVNVR